MTPDEELAEMRRQYPAAQLKTHMLVDGRVRLRCLRCGKRPVPEHYYAVANCDPCLDERIAKKGV